MTIRGGGNPNSAMAVMPLREWTRRLGALPAEAYDCFMVGNPIRVQPNTSLWRDCLRTKAGSPRIISQAAPDRSLRATAMEICRRDGRMLAARVEQKNGATSD
jgi:hypothetical protein